MLSFLEDYMRSDSGSISPTSAERIVSYASAFPGISLAELLEQVVTFATRDHIYLLIAAGRFRRFARWAARRARRRPRFPGSRLSSTARFEPNNQPSSLPRQSQTLRAGGVVTWDGRAWQVANIGATTVALLGEGGRLLELPDATIESLVKQGRMTQSSEDPDVTTCHKISDELLHASEEDLQSPTTGRSPSANASPEKIRPEQPFQREHCADGSRDIAPPKRNSTLGTSDCCRGLLIVGIQLAACQNCPCG